jgi:hypothetical protein
MRKQRLLASFAIMGAVATGITGGASTAVASPAANVPASVTGDWDCGIFTCSYVFSKGNTNTIANDGTAAIGLCGGIPTPGNGACAAAIAAIVITAKVAKNQGKCVKINVPRVPPFGAIPTTDGSSRCR